MSQTLQQRITAYIKNILSYEGAWMVWCDPRNDWGPLLNQVAQNEDMRGIALLSVTERTAKEIGGLLWRRRIQELIDAKQSFVLHVLASENELGWLWAQALLAEHLHTDTLRQMLQQWGWRPQNSKTGPDEVARLARLYIQQDPAEWGGGGLQPDRNRLLRVLSGGALTATDDRMILNFSISAAGLPDLDEEDVDRWRTKALAHLLITQAHRVAPNLFEHHDYLITLEKREFALDLLDTWVDSARLSKNLGERILEADRILMPGSYMGLATLETIGNKEAFLSQAAERTLFAQTCQHLAEKRGRELLEPLAALADSLAIHAKGYWGDTPETPGYSKEHSDLRTYLLPWGEVARWSRAITLLLQATPPPPWKKPEDAINWYVQKGWQVEQAGEQLSRHVSRATAELITLLTPLRDAYLHRWEDSMIRWSHLWTNAGCPPLAVSSQGEWLEEQLKEKRPTAVLVIDALRYDIGMVLKDAMNEREGADRAQITHARTALPAITALGMGMALPLKEEDLQADIINGKWQLTHKKSKLNLSIAEYRREWLVKQAKISPDAFLTIADIEAGNVPKPHGKLTRIFLFDDLIDKLGHDEELEPLGTGEVRRRYLRTVEHLQSKGWHRILIVTDHGYIHWPGFPEHRVAPPLPDAAYSSRRAMAYPAEASFEGPQGLAPGGKWRIAVASGTTCFRTYGGLSFFHGGASLQEWIVPCIKIEWPSKAKPVEVNIKPISQILSLRPKILVEAKLETLFGGGEAVARQVEVRIREQIHNTVIFRSSPKIITPTSEPVEFIMELIEPDGITVERGTTLLIEVRDIRTDELIADVQTTLMVSIESW